MMLNLNFSRRRPRFKEEVEDLLTRAIISILGIKEFLSDDVDIETKNGNEELVQIIWGEIKDRDLHTIVTSQPLVIIDVGNPTTAEDLTITSIEQAYRRLFRDKYNKPSTAPVVGSGVFKEMSTGMILDDFADHLFGLSG